MFFSSLLSHFYFIYKSSFCKIVTWYVKKVLIYVTYFDFIFFFSFPLSVCAFLPQRQLHSGRSVAPEMVVIYQIFHALMRGAAASAGEMKIRAEKSFSQKQYSLHLHKMDSRSFLEKKWLGGGGGITLVT